MIAAYLKTDLVNIWYNWRILSTWSTDCCIFYNLSLTHTTHKLIFFCTTRNINLKRYYNFSVAIQPQKYRFLYLIRIQLFCVLGQYNHYATRSIQISVSMLLTKHYVPGVYTPIKLWSWVVLGISITYSIIGVYGLKFEFELYDYDCLANQTFDLN